MPDTRPRRTFAVISHPDAGKSTLTEALALHARVITEAGAVHGKGDRRATVSDWMAMEKARGISITSAALQFVYRDHGSLVSLSRYSTVGSLMGNLVGGRMAIEGRLARFVYVSLYRKHLLAVHGFVRGLLLILVGHVNQVVRPKFKLH